MVAFRFPNETDEYRKRRDLLLKAELELRQAVEEVAKLRRTLPLGGQLPEDYVFQEGARDLADDKSVTSVRLSELFLPGKDTLALYNFMYGPKMEKPCPMCTSFLDALDRTVPHATQRIGLAVVAKSPIARIRAFARGREWKNLRLLSSAENTYNTTYGGENPNGNQLPMMNIFTKKNGVIHHFWGTDSFFAPSGEGQDSRHIDMMWPLWNLLDLTPEGRGSDFRPKLSYD